MTQYGNGMKATEFTKKQINVIYAMAKSGELKVEKWYISWLYDMAEYYGYDDNRSVEWAEMYIREILKKVFDHDISGAQADIIKHTDYEWNLFSRKNQAKCDRTVFVK